MYSSHVGCLLFYLGQDGMLGKAEGLARGIDGTFLSVLSRWRDAISPTSRACDLPPWLRARNHTTLESNDATSNAARLRL